MKCKTPFPMDSKPVSQANQICGIWNCNNTAVGFTEVKTVFTTLNQSSIFIAICNSCVKKLGV